MTRTALALGLFAACAALPYAAGQAPKAAPAAKADPRAKGPQVPGYKAHKIEGFNLLIHQDVLDVPGGRYERSPMDVLELELKTLTRVMTPRAVELLRRLTVWVEWDEGNAPSNGRPGVTVAVYRGGHQLQVAANGLHPGKAKTVTVTSMRALTEMHQPKKDKGLCVLLHEFAHAVHDQLLGTDNPQINAAYKLAMERKLYDKSQYATTNAHEFFAEMTCAYLDRLDYFPTNRDDLKRHDPNTFRLMETYWGSAARKTAAAKSTAPGDGSDKFNMDVKFPESVRLGGRITGPAVDPAALKGKVVVLAYWGGQHAGVLARLNKLHDELKDYGVAVVAAYPFVRDPAEVKADAEGRGAEYAVVRSAFLQEGSDPPKNQDPPHALIFDPDGTCVFRGSAFDADRFARAAVGRGLLARMDREEPVKGLKPAADALASGATSIQAAASRVYSLTTFADDETKAEAKKLYELITAPGLAALTAAADGAKDDPVGSFVAAERLAAAYKGSGLGSKAQGLADKLKSDKAVAAELKARAALVPVLKLEAHLSAQEGAFDPSGPRFQQKNAPQLLQLKQHVEQMRKAYPSSRAVRQADRVAREYGIP